MTFFRPSDPFVTNTPYFLEPKFEYYLTEFVGTIIQFCGWKEYGIKVRYIASDLLLNMLKNIDKSLAI